MQRSQERKDKARIITRIKQASLGDFGDAKPLSDDVSEMRIHFGPGYRVYYAREGRTVYLLLSGSKGTTMTTIKTAPFDAAEYLDSEEAIAAYLSAALEEDDPALFLAALADVAKARGMTQMAKDAGVGRESLYKTLAPGAKPRYDTVLKLAKAAGVKFTVEPAHA